MSIEGVKSRWAIATGALALLMILAASGCSDGGDSENVRHDDRPNQGLNQSDAPNLVGPPARLDVDANRQSALSVEACSAVPCSPRDVSGIDISSNRLGSSGVALSIGPAGTVEEVLEKGLLLAGASPAHLAIRGVASSDSIRCDWRGIARTAEQREDAIRYWLGLDADDEIPHAASSPQPLTRKHRQPTVRTPGFHQRATRWCSLATATWIMCVASLPSGAGGIGAGIYPGACRLITSH